MATQSHPTGIKLFGKQEEAGQSLLQLALRRLRRDKLTLIAIGVILVLGLLSVFAPFISEHILRVDPNHTDVYNAFGKPGELGHILGTDDLGRDHISRLLYAGRISLSIGFLAAALSLIIGLTVGIITGFYGGIIDDMITWGITTLNSIPTLFLLMIVSAVLAPNATSLVLVLGFVGWTGTARLVRGETLSIREREFIVSARAIGCSKWRIMVAHIAPNLFSIVVISLAIDIGTLILVESGLSFLGFGVQPPTPTWGNMLTNAQSFFTKGAHLVIMPGILITITVLCLYIIGDGIRDAFDPQAVD
jgi:peptide/nickel transport system permease protein